MTRIEVEKYLKSKNWHPFYNDNYWIAPGGSDYSGVTLCQAYCTARYGQIPAAELFQKVIELEFELNRDKKLGIVGKTFTFKNELKSKWGAQWEPDKKMWYVSADKIQDHIFHDYCYDSKRRVRFEWFE
jgi:hypothetical protein